MDPCFALISGCLIHTVIVYPVPGFRMSLLNTSDSLSRKSLRYKFREFPGSSVKCVSTAEYNRDSNHVSGTQALDDDVNS
jgi:hypothetical protein